MTFSDIVKMPYAQQMARKNINIENIFKGNNLTSTTASVRKEDDMEEMNQAEISREETEQKMIYKFLLMIKESESLEELEEKAKALLRK